MEYTKQEYNRFTRLVRMGGSRNQMDRINARLEMPKLVKELGKDKCQVMYDDCIANGDDDPDYQ